MNKRIGYCFYLSMITIYGHSQTIRESETLKAGTTQVVYSSLANEMEFELIISEDKSATITPPQKDGWSWSGSDVECGSGENQLFSFSTGTSLFPSDAFTAHVTGKVGGCSGSGSGSGSGSEDNNEFDYVLIGSIYKIYPEKTYTLIDDSVMLELYNVNDRGDVSTNTLKDADNWYSTSSEDYKILVESNGVEAVSFDYPLSTIWFQSSVPGEFEIYATPTESGYSSSSISRSNAIGETMPSSATASAEKGVVVNIKMDFTLKFKLIESETDMILVTPEGSTEKIYRILGGTRIKIIATVEGETPQSYEWSVSGGGKFYDGYGTNAAELTGEKLKGSDLSVIYYEPGNIANLDADIKLTIEFDDGELAKKFAVESRLLKPSTPSLKGDDVKMLQSKLRLLGLSEELNPTPNNGKYGIGGDPVTVDGDYGPKTQAAVGRFQERCDLSDDKEVGSATLGKLYDQWSDFYLAYEKYSTSPKVNKNHADFEDWIAAGAVELSAIYTEAIAQTVDPDVSAEDILKAWVNKETSSYGHWGFNVPYRITVGAWDNQGSMGFSQIQNRYKYGSNPKEAIQNINVYDPGDAIKAFAIYSNDISLGGGFYRAFSGRQVYKKNKEYGETYPRIDASYTDTNKDLLSKGIMAYNGGGQVLVTTTWPELLRIYLSPTSNTAYGVRTAMSYTLKVQKSAGIDLASWNWVVNNVITSGNNGVCNTNAHPDDEQITDPGVVGKVCVGPGADGVLQTQPSGDDSDAPYTFEFTEEGWLNGESWEKQRNSN